MTRETKVGLVVGTGIILLIGIVVSDHLASQQRGQQQTAAPTGYQDYATGAPTRTIDPRDQARPLVENQQPATPLAPLPPAGARGNDIGNGQRTQAIGLNNVGGAATRPDPLRDTPSGTGAVTDRNLDAALAGGATPGITSNNTGNPLAGADRRVPDSDRPGRLTADLQSSGFLPQDNTPRLSNPSGGVTDAQAFPSARPTEPLIHHVQAGETLWGISQKFYGDGKYHADIARANAEKLLADGGVREGVRLVIPNKPIVAPGVRGSESAVADVRLIPPLDRTNAGALATTNPATPTVRTIKIEPGDALSTIASRELGSIRHMPLIIAANRDQIDDANDIKAGMTLRIPMLPASSEPATINHAAPIRTVAQGSTVNNVNTYTVQPRDTFSSIARARLGDERRWKEIFDLNKSKVRSANALRAGEVLILPADAR